MKSAIQIIREPAVDLVDLIAPNLPDGWVGDTLGDHVYIAGRIGWRGLKAEEYTPAGPLLLSVPNLNHGDAVDFQRVNHISQVRYDESPEIKLKAGDTLLVKDGAGIGKLGYVESLPAEATVNSSLLVVRPHGDLLTSKYLFYYLKGPTFQRLASERITGSATPHLFQKDLKLLRIVAPPPPEQRRIVHRVESCLSGVVTLKEHLSRVPAILKRFRQVVLAAACSGKLTEDWRREHNDVEPAGHLLLRIGECRKRKSGHLPHARSLAEDVDEQASRLTDLPDSWTWCRVDQIATVGLGGTPSRKKFRYWGGDIPWVSSGEVANCRIGTTREYITAEGLANSNAKVYPSNTVLIAMIGEGKTRGQSAILDTEASTNQNVAGLVFDSGNVNPEYMWYWALSEYEQNRAVGRGGAQPALNGQKVRALPLPLPPLEEQDVIVGRIRALFECADALEVHVSSAKSSTDKLAESILGKAFRGELVPTEAELARREGREYESASALLERIKKERVRETKPFRIKRSTRKASVHV